MLKLFKDGQWCVHWTPSSSYSSSLLLVEYILQYSGERIGQEFVAISLVELVLELDPMETERVQEALKQIHAHEDAEGDGPEYRPKY